MITSRIDRALARQEITNLRTACETAHRQFRVSARKGASPDELQRMADELSELEAQIDRATDRL